MHQVKKLLSRHLLSGQHRALVVFSGNAAYLDATNRSVNLKLEGMGQIEILYDDLDFRIQSVSGDVYVNNRQVAAGDTLPGACVVALGRGRHRQYITFDLSHPEFVL
jgi:serine/threonine-protein kinase